MHIRPNILGPRSLVRIAALPQPNIQAVEPLPDSVATVNDDISSRSIGRSVAEQVNVSPLELLGVAVATEGDEAPPQVLGLLVDEVGQARVDVARGDAVDAGKVAPLVGERLGHVDAAGLGHVVRGLLLGVVGDVAGHGRGDDEGALALLLEVGAHGLGAVCRAGEICTDHSVPLLGRAVDDAAVGCGTSAGGGRC